MRIKLVYGHTPSVHPKVTAGRGKAFRRVPSQGMVREGTKVRYGSNTAHYYDSIYLKELRNTARNFTMPGWHLIQSSPAHKFSVNTHIKSMPHASTCVTLALFPLGWN